MKCAFRLPNRMPRINGDTRRRKRRLREKLDKLDLIRYAPAIRAAQRILKTEFEDAFLRAVMEAKR